MVPFCVTKATGDTDGTTLTKFRAKTSPYSRSDIVVKAGWAALAGAKFPDNAVARACSERLFAAK